MVIITSTENIWTYPMVENITLNMENYELKDSEYICSQSLTPKVRIIHYACGFILDKNIFMQFLKMMFVFIRKSLWKCS